MNSEQSDGSCIAWRFLRSQGQPLNKLVEFDVPPFSARISFTQDSQAALSSAASLTTPSALVAEFVRIEIASRTI